MRTLGIDYGGKRVGIAISDENNAFALPLAVLPNDRRLVASVKKIATEKTVGTIVLGESRNFKGEPNAIMKDIEKFKDELEKETRLKVEYEPEFLTSAEAARVQGKTKMHDASAAALILKSYLDKQANQGTIQLNHG